MIAVRSIENDRPLEAYSAKGLSLVAGDHVIASFIGDTNGPTLIAVGSLHGNEPAGAEALRRVAQELSALNVSVNGRVYFLAGNTRALLNKTRFVESDLNRHWTPDNLSRSRYDPDQRIVEDIELSELDGILDHILVTARNEVYVLDLHSTSADGMPFATVGDTLRNREFARKFPVTILLGIEEQLDGTMLEYLNNLGAVTLGFEGGQHQSDKTVETHESLVRLALVNAGLVNDADLAGQKRDREILSRRHSGPMIYEVRYRHAITSDDKFEMKPGFNNFDSVRKGQILANDRNGAVTAPESGSLLMPLYQALGEDGFFVGRRVAPFWLWLSGILRRLGIPAAVHWLPGVARDPNDPETLIVNTRIARLFPLQVFHLLGFRRRRWKGDKLIVSRRKHDTHNPFVN